MLLNSYRFRKRVLDGGRKKTALSRMFERPNGKLRPILDVEFPKNLVQVLLNGSLRQM
jgi:hypothetical protein